MRAMLDDRKSGIKFDQQREQIGYRLRNSQSSDVALPHCIRELPLSQNYAFKRGPRRCHHSPSIWSGLADYPGQCAVFQSGHNRLGSISKLPIDDDVR